MSCFSPLTGYYSKTVNASGKRSLVFSRDDALSGVAVTVPCGNCRGCRLERARGWAMRCLHESKMHRENSFITLTYDPDHIRKDGSLVLRDLQLFFKRLRKFIAPRKVRFYAAGEYGDATRRPHYHAILFGLDFPDKRFYQNNDRGEPLYTSEILDQIWGQGQCQIGAVTFESCSYVARYVMKKRNGQSVKDGYYAVMDMDGNLTELLPEFGTMSRRPGIGDSYYRKYGHEIRTHDSVIVDGKPVPSIRYYDLKFAEIDPHGFEKMKRVMREHVPRYTSRWYDENSSRRRWAKEALAARVAANKERKL